jgi:hypothetical protein
VDTYEPPNWQGGKSTPHTRYAITIVGSNTTANPPTCTDIDTCGRICNGGAGNSNGQIHTITQAAMVKATPDRSGSGVTW